MFASKHPQPPSGIVEDLCFVLMPFSAELVGFYDNAVKLAVESLGLTCTAADDIKSEQNDIMEDIWSAFNQARFVIAEFNGRKCKPVLRAGNRKHIG